MKHYGAQSIFRRPLIRIALCAALLLALGTGAPMAPVSRAVAALPSCGVSDITINATWSSSCAVTTSLTVKTGATLTINPGVEVRFAPGRWLRVEGGLTAHGTPARQIRMLGTTTAAWTGIVVVQPSNNVMLQSVTLSGAQAGLAIQPPVAAIAVPPSQVNITDSLFISNTTAISVTDSSVRLTLRNNLLWHNGTGLLVQNPGNGQSSLKLNHNSFVGNGIALKVTGQGSVRALQQWWGVGGPVVGDTASCAATPAPGASTRNLICGAVAFTPASKRPTGRMILPAGAGTELESELGPSSDSGDGTTPTSLAILRVPQGSFAQQVDLLIPGRSAAEVPPVRQPNLRPTPLYLEVVAVAGGQEIHRFAGGQSLTLTIRYLPGDLGGTNPSKLLLYYWDESLQIWSFQGFITSNDPAHQQLVVRLEHLSRMVIMEASMQQVALPMIMN